MTKKAKTKKSKKPTVVTFVLDETGSMESIRDDTIGGYNTYLDSLKDEEHGKVFFSLVKFDSSHITKVYVGEPIKNVAKLTRHTYTPGFATPLIDACYKSILATQAFVEERDDKPNVIVAIQTDGQENCPREHSFSDLAALIKEKTDLGWQFVFIGAGIDAFDQASQMGIAASNTMSYDRGKSKAAFGAMAQNTAMFRSTGLVAAMCFTETQRTKAGGDAVSASVLSKTTAKKPIVDDFKL